MQDGQVRVVLIGITGFVEILCGGSGRIDDSNISFCVCAFPARWSDFESSCIILSQTLHIYKAALVELNRRGVVFAGLISVGIVKEANSGSDQIVQRVLFSVEICSRPWNPRGIDTKDVDCSSGVVQRRVSSSKRDAKTLALKSYE